ncbi:hypothetical protein HX109_07055 [Galbibacter sp. BG1]|uniref:hypothetical protein n=1 Tax=Galbibacter sp. BG1 TaxID=1170699 RepID=UPI0015BE1DD0|nr:hypothetical protein [Galbibacter sp. BG1]QLE01335.1 hypothetical protein HX109_07055 [Galbibacter sp. BG1]
MTPAIITVVERNADISYYYNLAEEEKKDSSNELKEIKQISSSNDPNLSISVLTKKRKGYHYDVFHHYDQVIDVVIPPPELL